MNTLPFVFILLALLAGAALGAGLVFWLLRGRADGEKQQAVQLAEERIRHETSAEIASLHERLNSRTQDTARLDNELEKAEARQREAVEAVRTEHEERIAQMDERLQQLTRENAEYRAAIRETEMELRKEREAAAEKLKLLDEAQQKLAASFEALSRKALDSNNQSFLDLARTQLGSLHEQAKSELEKREKAVESLVKPINERLETFGKAVQAIEVKREGAYQSLTEQIRQLQEAEKSLHGTAQELTSALKGKSQRWGSWGEMQLRRVVEMADMIKYVDFSEQQVAEGGRDRPDLIVNLPGQRRIIVDSKAVTEAYMPVVEAATEELRAAAATAYAQKVRRRLQELSTKSYWEQFEGSAEFVIMFLPGESFFSAALEADPGLIEFGASNRVILATPTTLIALLRTVALGWRQEQIAENAREISDLGRELFNRIRTMAEHLQAVGKNLGQATDAYNRAVGSLETRVLPQARKFSALGAGGKDDIPELQALESAPRALSHPDHLFEAAADGEA
ncbi:DNA recombination protein RmuC [bacterium]|nr:DNA recombination protein RmuC [bacterium]